MNPFLNLIALQGLTCLPRLPCLPQAGAGRRRQVPAGAGGRGFDRFIERGSHTDILYPGDSIYYNSNIPHRVQCHEDRITKILAALYTLNN